MRPKPAPARTEHTTTAARSVIGDGPSVPSEHGNTTSASPAQPERSSRLSGRHGLDEDASTNTGDRPPGEGSATSACASSDPPDEGRMTTMAGYSLSVSSCQVRSSALTSSPLASRVAAISPRLAPLPPARQESRSVAGPSTPCHFRTTAAAASPQLDPEWALQSHFGIMHSAPKHRVGTRGNARSAWAPTEGLGLHPHDAT